MSDLLDEIVGAFTPSNRNVPISGPTQNPHSDIRKTGIELSYCASLESWQKNIINGLVRGKDQYVIARPGGGKTLPFICHWTNNMLDLNTMMTKVTNINIQNSVNVLFAHGHTTVRTRQQIPKIMFMVPVITLAQQTAMEIRKHIATIMLQMYNNFPNYYIDKYLRHINKYNINKLATEAYNLRQQIAQGNDNGRLQQALNGIYKNIRDEAELAINEMINSMVYMKTGQSSSNSNPKEALVYVTIYESASSLIKNKSIDINQLGLVVLDESHLIQESGVVYDDSSRAYQISGHLFDVLDMLKKNNSKCRLAMLSGTVNPTSAKNVTDYFNMCFKRNFDTPTAAPASATNRSQLTIIPNETINTDDGIVKLILNAVNTNEWGQLYVLFSTNRINKIVERCINKLGIKNPENYSPNSYEFKNVFGGLGSRRQDSEGINLRTSADKLAIPQGMHLQVNNISNPLLRQAILRGIGFIYRNIPGNELEGSKPIPMNDTDKLIVAKLFRERKISVLLATDSVGIGVNIDVKDIYVPRLQKYNANIKDMMDASLRDLAQILNRAGRGATPIASIHTPSENIESVTNALYADPEDLPSVDALKKSGSFNLCQYKMFHRFLANVQRLFN
mgnify:CR=1 FL=1